VILLASYGATNIDEVSWGGGGGGGGVAGGGGGGGGEGEVRR
jgi:hypothetical protein